MDSRLHGNDKERSITTQSWVSAILAKRSPSFPRRRESIGHHSDPHWGSFLESTESSMPESIFSGASTYCPLIADGHSNPVAYAADLFRAPLSRQRQLNEVDRVLWHPVLDTAAPSLLCQSMSLCRIILSFPSVTSQLPINRGAMNIDDSSD